MNDNLRNIIAPSVLTIFGLFFLIFAGVTGQNTFFVFGASGVTLAGVVAVLNALNLFKKSSRMIVVGVLAIVSVSLAGLNYKSIMDPIEFNAARDLRSVQAVQKLKDLRVAQMAYKSTYGTYVKDIDTLLKFIQYDSLPVVKSIGSVPDTLSEEQALEQGFLTRDTTFELVQSAIYTESYMAEREFPFDINKLIYIPFSGGQKFVCDAGEIERNTVLVQVFEIRAPKEMLLAGLNERMINREEDLTVGSMSEPSTNGNWGE